MKPTTITMVTVDGVMQGLGGLDEDPQRIECAADGSQTAFDDEALAFLNQVYERASSCSAGGPTRSSSRPWGTWPDPAATPSGRPWNTKPKHLAPTTLTDPQWADTTIPRTGTSAS